MNKRKNGLRIKVLSLFMTIAICIPIFPAGALTAYADPPANGYELTIATDDAEKFGSTTLGVNPANSAPTGLGTVTFTTNRSYPVITFSNVPVDLLGVRVTIDNESRTQSIININYKKEINNAANARTEINSNSTLRLDTNTDNLFYNVAVLRSGTLTGENASLLHIALTGITSTANVFAGKSITITYLFIPETTGGDKYTAAISDNANGTATCIESSIEPNVFTLHATPNAGYVFDHWEYRESTDGETWNDDWVEATEKYADLTTATGDVTVTAHTQFRAHFRPSKITLYKGGEAELNNFKVPNFWVGSKINEEYPWYYYDEYFAGSCVFGSLSSYESKVPDRTQTPVYVGSRATLSLPIAVSDGNLIEEHVPGQAANVKGVPYNAKLYFGDEQTPSQDIDGYAANSQAGELLHFTSTYIRPFPDVKSIRLVVTMYDAEGTPMVVERTYAVNPVSAQDVQDPVTVSMSIEALSIPGFGKFIADPVQVTVGRGESVAMALSRFMGDRGINPGTYINCVGSYTGDSFYVTAFRDYAGYESMGGDADGWLREKELGEGAGWMYSVNGVFPEVSAGARPLSNGDVIRWQYTCAATQGDIGKDLAQDVDRTHLLAKIAAINTSDTKNDYGVDYDTALAVLKDLTKTQEEVDAAFLLLNGGVPLANMSALSNALSEANMLKSSAEVGAEPGTYPQTAYDDFAAAISVAQAVRDNDSLDQADIDAATQTLIAATQTFAASKIPVTDYLPALNAAQQYIAEITAHPIVDSVGGEWAVLALARGGKITGAIRNAYLEELRAAIAEAYSKTGGKVILEQNKPTENERVVLALTALGIDASNFEGYDLVTPLTTVDWVNSQGINSTIFALLALDSKPYTASSVRNELIAEILEAQSSATGDWSDANLGVDMAAMAVQALAPYYRSNSEVRTAVDSAVTALSTWVQANEAASDGASSESYAQIVTALSALGIDAATDERFVNGGRNALADFLKYANANGSFTHTYTGAGNQMATEQAAYALVAYDRFKKGGNSLYTMSDAFSKVTVPESVPENVTVTEDTATVVVETPTPTVTEDGAAQAAVTVNVIDKAIQDAEKAKTDNPGKSAQVEISVPPVADSATGVAVSIPKAGISAIAESKLIDDLVVKTQAGEFEIGSAALATIASSAGEAETVTLSITKGDAEATATEDKPQVKGASVFEIEVRTSEKVIHELGGDIKVSLPYTLKANEQAGNVKVYYLPDQGEPQKVASTYDSAAKKVSFVTNHLSLWAVNATAPGWKNEDGSWYFYDSDGKKLTGWNKDGDAWYYLDPAKDGKMASGWQQISDTWYHFGSAKDGAMKTGWQKISGAWYYLDPAKGKTGGAMKAGWQKIEGKWYHLGAANDGAMKTGWNKDGALWYLHHGKGHMLTGWQKVGGTWYYLHASGKMLTGAQKIGGKTYTFKSNGAWVS